MKAAFLFLGLQILRAAAADPVPRATSGDDRVEPAWEEKLTVRVGLSEGDIRGDSDKAIQAAVDYVSRLGGGTVEVLPGTYRFRNSVFLASRIRLLGYSEDAEATFQRLRAIRPRTGRYDLRIAAIALVNRALLLSQNLSDFRPIPGLRVEDWTA